MSTDIDDIAVVPAGEDHRFYRRLLAEERHIKSEADARMERVQIEQAGRMTEEDHAEFKRLEDAYAKAKDACAAELDRIKIARAFTTTDGADVLGQSFGRPVPTASPTAGKSLGEAWVASGVWKAMTEKYRGGRLSEGFKSEAVELPSSALEVLFPSRGFKAASSPLLESNFTTGFGGAITTLLPGVERPGLVQLPPTVSDLLRVIPVREGNSVTYRIQKSRTMPGYPASQPVAEGATKPTYATEFDVVRVDMKKLAAITKISEEWLEDDEATVAFLNTELPAQIRQVEENWLTALLYTGVTDATGLGYGTVSFDNIAAAISVIQTAGFNPNGMLIKPADWWNLTVSKFGTGAGDKTYVGGGPFGTTGNPWGLTVVQTPYATAGHPLIGDFSRGGWIARRGGIRMDSTNSNVDDFEKNLVTLRVELREAFKVVYPEAFKTAAI